MSEGTARVVDKAVVEMVTDGPCLAGTLEQLGVGVGAKPMPAQALAKVRTDALGLLAKVLEAYVNGVAPGEVGMGGSAGASDAPPVGGRPPTGLLTATPYALLLQNVDNDLRPTFTHLLEPGQGYTGGEAFFDVQHVEETLPPLVSVDEDESANIESAAEGSPPLGLQRALAFFLVAAGAQNVVDPLSRSMGQNFLCHTSQKTTEHARVAMLIRSYLNRLSDDLEAGGSDTETVMRLHWGHDELRRTMTDPPE